jgi:hypothetical protein
MGLAAASEIPLDCVAALVWFEVMRPQVLGGEGARTDWARNWELTARVTLAVAVGAGVLAAVTSPPWAPGDLLVATYFAAVSLMLWGQGARIRRARSKAPFTTAVAVALGVAFAGGLLLAVVDVATRGSL